MVNPDHFYRTMVHPEHDGDLSLLPVSAAISEHGQPWFKPSTMSDHGKSWSTMINLNAKKS